MNGTDQEEIRTGEPGPGAAAAPARWNAVGAVAGEKRTGNARRVVGRSQYARCLLGLGWRAANAFKAPGR